MLIFDTEAMSEFKIVDSNYFIFSFIIFRDLELELI